MASSRTHVGVVGRPARHDRALCERRRQSHRRGRAPWAASRLHAWAATTGTPLFERDVDARVGGLAFDPAARYLLAVLGPQVEVPSGLPPGVGLKVWALGSERGEVLGVPERENMIAFDFSADDTRSRP